jgi:hypothetical protein
LIETSDKLKHHLQERTAYLITGFDFVLCFLLFGRTITVVYPAWLALSELQASSSVDSRKDGESGIWVLFLFLFVMRKWIMAVYPALGALWELRKAPITNCGKGQQIRRHGFIRWFREKGSRLSFLLALSVFRKGGDWIAGRTAKVLS